jgi:hypothetical protein
LYISKAIRPSNPAWMVGAVMWMANPRRASALRPATRAEFQHPFGRRFQGQTYSFQFKSPGTLRVRLLGPFHQ